MSKAHAKYSTLFGAVAAVAVYLFHAYGGLIGYLSLYVAIASLVLTATYAAGKPELLAKRTNGKRGIVLVVLLLPYLIINEVLLFVSRKIKLIQDPVEIVPGLWVGPRLRSGERYRLPEKVCVLDMAAEFTEAGAMRELTGYKSIPALDGVPPTVAQCTEAIEWGLEKSASSPLYVHCASGYGRSVIVVAALMVAKGDANTVEDALAAIKAKRPGASPTKAQIDAIDLAVQLMKNSPEEGK